VPTTVYIPDDVLEAVDKRAKRLNMSRNRFVVEALKRVLQEQAEWSPDFTRALATLKPIEGVNEMLREIRKHRTRKAPPRL
jgi:metal-responsive CopG/Arc/MetJ family transcriptional regulator